MMFFIFERFFHAMSKRDSLTKRRKQDLKQVVKIWEEAAPGVRAKGTKLAC